MAAISVRLASRPHKVKEEVVSVVSKLDHKLFPGVPDYYDKTYWWLATLDGELAGYAGMRYLANEDYGYFSRAGVLKPYRRKGVHRKLITARLSYAKRQGWSGVLTYALQTNYPSINSLMSMGFKMYSPDYAWAGASFSYFRFDLKKA